MLILFIHPTIKTTFISGDFMRDARGYPLPCCTCSTGAHVRTCSTGTHSRTCYGTMLRIVIISFHFETRDHFRCIFVMFVFLAFGDHHNHLSIVVVHVFKC